MHEYVTILIQREALGAATASRSGRAPIASFWVRIMTSCMNIKRGVLLDIYAQLKPLYTFVKQYCPSPTLRVSQLTGKKNEKITGKPTLVSARFAVS